MSAENTRLEKGPTDPRQVLRIVNQISKAPPIIASGMAEVVTKNPDLLPAAAWVINAAARIAKEK